MKRIRRNRLFRYIVIEIFKKRLLKLLNDKQFIILEYFVTTRKLPNLKNPSNFTEKMQWIKLYGNLERYAEYVDKLKVRDYVRDTVGEKYLSKILSIWNHPNDIDYDALPKSFVMKTTHGSHYVQVCKDIEKLDIKQLKKDVKHWYSEDYYIKSREIQYKNSVPRIFLEEYLEDVDGELPDYKIWCYNGVPKIVEVVFWDDKEKNIFGDVYMDLDWNPLNISYIKFPYSKKALKKPDNLDEMLEVARKLSHPFPFVRVDLYNIQKRIVFGELTFTPGSGLERFDPPEADVFLGELIDLEEYLK